MTWNVLGQRSHPFFPLARVALLEKGQWQQTIFGRKSFGAANVLYVPAGRRTRSLVQQPKCPQVNNPKVISFLGVSILDIH